MAPKRGKRQVKDDAPVLKRPRAQASCSRVAPVPSRRSSGSQALPLPTLAINLSRRADRWTNFHARVVDLERQSLLRILRLAATDGRSDAIPENVVGRTWTTDRNARYDGRQGYRPGVQLTLTPGELGCAYSHVRAWRAVAAIATGPVLVLEDDAVFMPRFAERLPKLLERASAASADVLYLGYIQGAPWRQKVAAQLHEAEYLWTTVAYVMWPKGAERLLAALPVDSPIDNFMAWQMSMRNLFALAAVPPLVDQELEWDQGSDVPHSDDIVIDEAQVE